MMSLKRIVCLAFGLLFFSSQLAKADSPKRPNILFFYVDDMGWGSIGPNGQAARREKGLPSVKTPNLDRLASQGVNFTRGYGCHVCSPARSSLQTGYHQGHTFADRNDPNNAKKAIRADDPSIGKSLSSSGYVTGYWGKWGYGGSKDQVNPVIENVQTLPTSHGYKHVLAELHHVRAHTFFQPTLWSAPAKPNALGGLELKANSMAPYQAKKNYPNTPALQNHSDYPKTAYCDDNYAFAAMDFVRQQGMNYNKTGQPFFGLLAVQIPHAPFGEISTLPNWNAAYKNDPHFSSLSLQAQQWAAMVTRIDAHFGNILAALEDPNNDGDKSDSIAANTLVVFQSDNGGPAGKNNLEFNANGGLSGNKGKIQEGGIRVPLVMRWPAMITQSSKLKAGSNCDKIVDVTDLLPTFCELGGAEIPLGIDGVSIAPTLTGKGFQRQRQYIIHEAGNGQSIIQGNYKLVRQKKKPVFQLYNLEKDPGEKQNIAKQNSELVKDLKVKLLAERVTEAKGFANTYHQWIGKKSFGDINDAKNWSVYEYSNKGISYLKDDGAPKNSWTASIENKQKSMAFADVKSVANFLGLQIQGKSKESAQFLNIMKGGNLNVRNELRAKKYGAVGLAGGTITTSRWIDIQPNGSLGGFGKITGMIINNGRFIPAGPEQGAINLTGNYRQEKGAEFICRDLKTDFTALLATGNVTLAGKLTVDKVTRNDAKDKSLTIIEAKNIDGKFDMVDDIVQTKDGSRFKILYADTSVKLMEVVR